MPTWLRHRALVATEGVLLIGVAQELLQRQVLALDLPNALKVLFVMAATIGIIGLLLVVVQTVVVRSLAKTHEVAKAMPLPWPVVLVHLLVFTGLFLLYATVWDLPVWPLPGAR
jgi:hypothetical protein